MIKSKLSSNKSLMNNYLITMMVILNLLTLCTNNLINLWILMEINSLIFIFQLFKSKSFYNFSNATIIYVFQSVSSLIIIWIFVMNNNYYNFNFLLLLFYLSITMKLGMFPFFLIPPMLMKNMNWMTIFSMSTLQKFIPMNLIKIFLETNNISITMMLYICSISIILSTIFALMTNNIKMIMAYSSINNSSWMSMIILMDYFAFLYYFYIYTIIMFTLSKFMHNMGINNVNNFSNLNFYNSNYYLFIYLLLMMSMVPPFFSFIIKFYSSIFLTKYKLMLINLLMLIMSTLSTYMYIHFIIQNMYFNYFKFKYMFKMKISKMSFMILIFPWIMIMIPLMYFIMD